MNTKIQINQFLPSMSFGDAIGNNVLEIQKALIKFGYNSTTYTQNHDEKSSPFRKHISEYQGDKNNICIFHAAIGGDLFDYIQKLPDKKIMIYHNMTPSRYFKGFNDVLAEQLIQGKRQLKEIRKDIILGVGVSNYNTNELKLLNYKKTDTLPILINFKQYNQTINKTLQKDLKQNNTTNIIYVGRLSRHKKIEDTIKSFYFYNKYYNPNSKLTLIGSYDGRDTYFENLLLLIQKLKLENKIIIPGHISTKDLITYYKSADLFITMSEHEGFLVPILECYYFNLPFLAYNSSAIAETAGQTGTIFNKKDYDFVALNIDKIISNPTYRKEVLAKQQKRLLDFEAEKTELKLKKIISSVI